MTTLHGEPDTVFSFQSKPGLLKEESRLPAPKSRKAAVLDNIKKSSVHIERVLSIKATLSAPLGWKR